MRTHIQAHIVFNELFRNNSGISNLTKSLRYILGNKHWDVKYVAMRKEGRGERERIETFEMWVWRKMEGAQNLKG